MGLKVLRTIIIDLIATVATVTVKIETEHHE